MQDSLREKRFHNRTQEKLEQEVSSSCSRFFGGSGAISMHDDIRNRVFVSFTHQQSEQGIISMPSSGHTDVRCARAHHELAKVKIHSKINSKGYFDQSRKFADVCMIRWWYAISRSCSRVCLDLENCQNSCMLVYSSCLRCHRGTLAMFWKEKSSRCDRNAERILRSRPRDAASTAASWKSLINAGRLVMHARKTCRS